MAGYTRQSNASITSGAAITAAPLNAEFNQVLAALNNSTGHKHDGTAAEGPVIGLIGDPGVTTPLNKVVVDNTNNRVGVFVDAGGAGSTVEQVRFQDGLITPVTDNDIDLGASGAEFKNLYIDGTGYIDALEVHEGSTLTGALTVAGVTALNGGLTMDSNKFTVANTSGNTAIAGTLAVTGASALTGNVTAGGTLAVTGNATIGGTLAATGAVTANAGVVVDNITIDGTEIDLSSGDLTVDVAGDIILDADGGDVLIKDGGTQYAALTNTSGNLIVKSGSTTAATFSGANVDFAGTVDVTGAGTFDSTVAVAGVLSPATHVDMPDSANIKLGTDDDMLVYHDGSNGYVTNATGALKIATEASGIAVTIGHTTSEVTVADNLTIIGNLTVNGTQTVVDTVTMNAENAVVFEGATADDYETTLTIIDPTADRTINLPNQSGTIPVLAAASNDQVTATPAELSIMDGDKSAVSTTLADADRVVVNDAGTMKQVALTDFETYMETSLDTLSNVTTVGALNSGSISSGFGAIDNGSSAITTTGTITFGTLSDGSINVTAFVDEDNMASNSATLVPTQQSVKAYADAVNGASNNVTGLTASGAELNILKDATLTTAELNILDGSETTQATVTLVGTDGVVISDADVMKQALVSDFDTYVSGTTKTLTNKTLTSPVLNTGSVGTSLAFPDNAKALFGAGSDLQIYHRGDASFIDDVGTGNLNIRAESLNLANSDGSENYIRMAHNGAVKLYHDNSKKIETTATGVDVTGNVIATGTVEPAGDTAAGDNAAIGYTAAEGLILTGQGSTSDITFKNDADAAVFNIPTGTTTLDVTGTVQADQYNNDEALPDIRPSLLLDFANSKTLDPRITFTRGSTATFYDGKTTAKAEENLLTYSQDLSNAAWAKNGSTITADNTAAPDGTTTADKVQISTPSNYSGINQLFSVSASTTYAGTLYVKKSTHDYIIVGLNSYLANDSYVGTHAINRINLTNGGQIGSDIGTTTTTDVGNGWYKVTFVGTTASNSVNGRLVVEFSDSSGDTATGTSIGTDKGIYLWGAQIEQRSAATAYTPTTSAPVVKYQPTLQTAASGAARFDHDPTTGESKGLLIEEARTNLLPYSADFSNSAWVKSKAAVYSNQVIAPDGTQTASNVVGTTVSGEHYIQDYLTAATGTFTDSVFVKANGVTNFFIRPVHEGADEGATQTANFNLSNGTIGSLPSNTTATITDVGNDWYRCTFTFTMTGTLSGSYGVRLQLSVTGDGYKGVYLWGAQREAGIFATSYIPTAGSTVTRAVDSVRMLPASFAGIYNPTESTMFSEFSSISDDTSYGRIWDIGSLTTNINRFALFHVPRSSNKHITIEYRTNDTAQASLSVISNTLVVTNAKVAATWAQNDFAAVANGGTVLTDGTGSIYSSIPRDTLGIGNATDLGSDVTGHLKKLAYYPKRLSDATLQAMTTE